MMRGGEINRTRPRTHNADHGEVLASTPFLPFDLRGQVRQEEGEALRPSLYLGGPDQCFRGGIWLGPLVTGTCGLVSRWDHS
jgi:hypothetical protein